MRARNFGTAFSPLAFALFACTSPRELPPQATAPPAAPEAAVSHSSRPTSANQARPQRAPLVVSVSAKGRVERGGDLDLTITLDRVAPGAATRLSVELPPGATLVSGLQVQDVPGDSTHAERSLRVHLAGNIPASDIHIVADTAGTGYGAHATTAYRFGRPDPVLAQPARTGAPVLVHGSNLGKPIELQ
jgi:hypothetical protein